MLAAPPALACRRSLSRFSFGNAAMPPDRLSELNEFTHPFKSAKLPNCFFINKGYFLEMATRVFAAFALWNLSPMGRARVLLVTLLGTLGCMAVALLAVSYTTQFMEEDARRLTIASAILIPILLSAPIFYYFASKLRELAIAHHELTIIASQDSLTACLNRGAFITLVDAYLAQVNGAAEPTCGGLLMVDADHFKSINDRFGHSAGDSALRMVANGIKSVLRAADLIGRVGGEEFAVFLPRTQAVDVEKVGDRIMGAVNDLNFRPAGRPEMLSVSVGGAVFRGPVSFAELFSTADARLYEAKRRGRNRAEYSAVGIMSLDARRRLQERKDIIAS
jgi:diguanylate cyclase